MQIGLRFIAWALAVRLFCGLAGPVAAFLAKPEIGAFLIYLETGRTVKPQITPTQTEPVLQETQPTQTEPSLPLPQQTEPPQLSSFQPEDTALIQVSNLSSYSVDLEKLLLSRLELEIPHGRPAVLIMHSHGTESYTQTAEHSYTASAAYRTLDTQCNMIRVGAALKEALEALGIQVIHDQTLHDYPSYTDAYVNSREAVESYLREYPSLCLVIDLHRDAADTVSGQLKTAIGVDGKRTAQLMLVVGTDASGRTHAGWEKNMALAVKLHAHLQIQFPGICRPISLRRERFNQDLSPGAILIEVGAAGDTLEDALAAVEALALGIAELLKEGSTS